MVGQFSISIVTLPHQMDPWYVQFVVKLVQVFLVTMLYRVLMTPNSPYDLGKQTISQAALGGVLALMSAPLQRHCFIYLSIFLIIVLCSLKVQRCKDSSLNVLSVVLPTPLVWNCLSRVRWITALLPKYALCR